jgi:hypothetical protein
MLQTTVTATTSPTPEWSSGSGEIVEEWSSVVLNQVIYLSFVAAIGTVANLVVIFQGIRYRKKLRSFGANSAAMNTTNMLVISLAVSNLGTSTFSVGIFILPMYVPYTLVDDFTCRFIWPLRELFLSASCYSFTFMAVGRYLILFQSFQNAKVFSSPAASNAALWIFSYLVIALPFSAAYKQVYMNGVSLCDTFWETPEKQTAHVTFVVLFDSLVPTFLVCLSYVGIIRRVRRVRNVFSSNFTAGSLPDNDRTLSTVMFSYRVAKISLLLLFGFFVTYLPFGALAMYIEYSNVDAFNFSELETLHAVAFCLLYTGAVINPLIIMFTSSEYRPKCGTINQTTVELNPTDVYGNHTELIT